MDQKMAHIHVLGQTPGWPFKIETPNSFWHVLLPSLWPKYTKMCLNMFCWPYLQEGSNVLVWAYVVTHLGGHSGPLFLCVDQLHPTLFQNVLLQSEQVEGTLLNQGDLQGRPLQLPEFGNLNNF